MKLLTEQIKEKFRKTYPLYSQESTEDPQVVVKYFNPIGLGTWYITEANEQEDGDWLMFGLCCIDEAEFGYICLSQLESLQLPYGLSIERDLYFDGRISDARKEQNL